MAFNDEPGRAEYIAGAGQTVFPFSFKIYQDGDVKVYLTPSGQSPDDAIDLLMLTNDYTVSINGDLGGTMTLVSGASVSDAITIVRELSVTRLVDYQTGGDLLATTLNLDQNYQTYLSADLKAADTRFISIPDSSQGVSTSLPDVAPDAYLKWNSAGDALENDTTIPDNVINSEDSNLEAGSWANENEDVAVKEYTAGVPSDRSPTVFSSKHHSLKSTESATQSATSATDSEDSSLESDSWANEDEDVPVKEYSSGTPSDRVPEAFSAKHYATKATSGGTERTSARNTVISTTNGSLALASTPTPSFATEIYTGNGTSQNIVTGLESTDPNWVSAGSYTLGQKIVYDYIIYDALTTHDSVATTPDADATNWDAIGANVHIPFLNSRAWIKGRSGATSNKVVDTLRGVGQSIITDATAAEATEATGITSFNVDGVSIGADTDYNTNTATYVTWQTQYDTMFYGTTNQGKKFVTAYNAQSGDGMTIYVGSGSAGHEIPHGLGTKLDYLWVKNRDIIADHKIYNTVSGATVFLSLNTTNAEQVLSSTWDNTEPTSQNFTTGSDGSVNNLNQNHVAYFSSNRENHTYTGSYIGTGVAGNVVDFGLDMTQAGSKVMIKRLDVTSNWDIHDNVRDIDGIQDSRLIASTASAEDTNSIFDIVFTTTGVIIDTSSNEYNASGGQYLIAAVVPNYDKPNGGLDVNADSIISYAEGTNGTTGDLDSIETTTLASDVTLIAGATNYIYIDKGNVKGSTIYPLLKQLDSTVDTNSDIYNVAEGVVVNPSSTEISRVYLGEVVVDGGGEVIPDTLEVYATKHLDVNELEVHGDAKFHGDVSGKNICTAWVNFDGTTTPPTIRSSYNVSDVVRIGTGQYDIYFNEDMDYEGYSTIADAEVVSVSDERAVVNITPVDKVRVLTYNGITATNARIVSVMVFGGKN